METIDLNPTWKMAVAIYIEVLLNSSDPTSDGVQAAKADLMHLAEVTDARIEEGKVTIDPNQLTIQFGD